MLLKRQGYPEESEIVQCTVTTVKYNSVFASLDEYDKVGMIHISEISPGRIRNIRDYVKEGKVIICKVINVNREKGYIDLSLRRVNEGQRREKVNQIKKEQKAEKIIEFVANKLKKDIKEVYRNVTEKVFQKYSLLSECFDDVVDKNITLEELGIEKALAKDLNDLIEQRIKPQEVSIKGRITLVSYAPLGIEMIKEALKQGTGKRIALSYMGAGKYSIKVTAPDYKEAEKALKDSTEAISKFAKKNHIEYSFEREEK